MGLFVGFIRRELEVIGFHVRGVTVSSLDPLELEAWKPE